MFRSSWKIYCCSSMMEEEAWPSIAKYLDFNFGSAKPSGRARLIVALFGRAETQAVHWLAAHLKHLFLGRVGVLTESRKFKSHSKGKQSPLFNILNTVLRADELSAVFFIEDCHVSLGALVDSIHPLLRSLASSTSSDTNRSRHY